MTQRNTIEQASQDGQTSVCPFCRLNSDQVVAEVEHALAFRDIYPVANGHTLIIPHRHVDSIFSLPPEELSAIWGLVEKVRNDLIAEFAPDAFTIGINDGIAAGQTIGHAHVHVIPRSTGDVPDARGGIRWVIPSKAPYWSEGA